MISGYIKFVRALSRFSGIVAAILLLVAVLVVVQMVFVRYILNQSTVWQTEVIVFAAVAATFIGSPYVLLRRGHINVDFVTMRLNPKWQEICHLISSVISLLFCALFFYLSLIWWYEAFSNQWTTMTIARIPLWIPWISLPLGMGGLVLQFIADLLEEFTGTRQDAAQNVYGVGSGETAGEKA